MNNLDRASHMAWGPVRAVLEEEFSFSEIKKIVGLARLEVSRLSHLSQKGPSYTSKGELMSSIDHLFSELSSDAAERFVRTVAEKICQRSEAGGKKLEDYCERYRYSYAGLKIGREKDLVERSSQARTELFLAEVMKLLEELSTLWDEFKSQPELARRGREKLRLWKDNAVKVLNEYSPEKATTLRDDRYGEEYTGDRAEYKTFQSEVEVYKDFLIALRDDIKAHPDYWSQQISASKQVLLDDSMRVLREMIILAKLGDIEPLVYRCARQADLEASAARGRPDYHMGEWNEAGIRLDMQAGQTKRHLATVELQQLGDKVKYALVPKVGITGEEQQCLHAFHDSLVTEIAQFDSSKQVTQEPPLYDIFISYSHKDEELAKELRQLLEGKGLKCFMSSMDIRSGDPWAETIRDALKGSQELLLVITPDSIDSKWVLCEGGAGWALGKCMVPALLKVEPDSLPEPIKRHQAKKIDTIAQREDLAKEIAERLGKYIEWSYTTTVLE